MVELSIQHAQRKRRLFAGPLRKHVQCNLQHARCAKVKGDMRLGVGTATDRGLVSAKSAQPLAMAWLTGGSRSRSLGIGFLRSLKGRAPYFASTRFRASSGIALFNALAAAILFGTSAISTATGVCWRILNYEKAQAWRADSCKGQQSPDP